MFAGDGMITVNEKYYSTRKRLRTSGLSYVKSAQLPRPLCFRVFDDGCAPLAVYTVVHTCLPPLIRLILHTKDYGAPQYNSKTNADPKK
jgi:hypothetical protein